jgi:hypothetical protein
VSLTFTNSASFGSQAFGVRILRYLELFSSVSIATAAASSIRYQPSPDFFSISSSGGFGSRTSTRADDFSITSGATVLYGIHAHENATNNSSVNSYSEVSITSVWKEPAYNIVPTSTSPSFIGVGFGMI